MAGNFVRITVDTGGLRLAYRADRPTAARYQAAMARDCPQFTVTVDDGDTSDLRLIPCAQLSRRRDDARMV